MLMTTDDVARYVEEGQLGRVTNVTDVSTGSISRVFKVETTHGTYAVKQAGERDNAVGDAMPIERIEYEAAYADHFVGTDMEGQVERLVTHDGGNHVNVFAWCDGVTLRRMLDDGSVLSPSLGVTIGQYLDEASLIPCDQMRQNPMDEVTVSHMLVDPFSGSKGNKVDDANKWLATAVYVDEELSDAPVRLSDAFRRHECLIHGDFTPNNVFVRQNGYDVVAFDFDFATPGNPAYDAGTMLGHLVLAYVLKSYEGASRDVLDGIMGIIRGITGVLVISDIDGRDTLSFVASTMLAHTYGHVPFWHISDLPRGTHRECCATIYGMVRELLLGTMGIRGLPGLLGTV